MRDRLASYSVARRANPSEAKKRLYASVRFARWQAARMSDIIRNMATRDSFSDDELVAYLDEMLPPDRMTSVEANLRASESLRHRVAALSRRRDQGTHSVGEIWRRLRLSCPTRSQLGGFLLGTLDGSLSDYIEFHLRSIGCRICTANLHDLESSRKAASEAGGRRRRFFESSAGRLREVSSRRRD